MGSRLHPLADRVPAIFATWRAAFLGLGVAAVSLAVAVLFTLPEATGQTSTVRLRQAACGLSAPALWLLGLCLFGLTLSIVGIGAWVRSSPRTPAPVVERRGTAFLAGRGRLAPGTCRRSGRLSESGRSPWIRASCLGLAVGVLLIFGSGSRPAARPADWSGLGWFSALPFGVILACVGGPGRRGATRWSGRSRRRSQRPRLPRGRGSLRRFVGAVRDASGSFSLGFALLLSGPSSQPYYLAAIQRTSAASRIADLRTTNASSGWQEAMRRGDPCREQRSRCPSEGIGRGCRSGGCGSVRSAPAGDARGPGRWGLALRLRRFRRRGPGWASVRLSSRRPAARCRPCRAGRAGRRRSSEA